MQVKRNFCQICVRLVRDTVICKVFLIDRSVSKPPEKSTPQRRASPRFFKACDPFNAPALYDADVTK